MLRERKTKKLICKENTQSFNKSWRMTENWKEWTEKTKLKKL